MLLNQIEIDILKLIRDFNDGDPVGFHTLDRMLISNHPDLIFRGELKEKLKNMEEYNLICITPKGGYLLTEYGKSLLA